MQYDVKLPVMVGYVNRVTGLIQTDLTTLEGDVTTLEGNLTTLEGRVDGIDTTLDYTNTTSTEQTSDGTVLSLGASAVKGELEATVEGVTLVNDVVNGDFSDGTTGWTSTNSTSSVTDNVLENTGNGSLDRASITKSSVSFIDGDIIFIYVRARVTNSDCQELRIRSVGGIVQNTVSTPTINQWYYLYKKGTAIDISASQISMSHLYADTATANGKVMEVDGNVGVFAINMTALGIESKTEDEMLALVSAGYFEGIASVEASRVKSVGKNLFDEKTITRGYYLGPLGLVPNDTSFTSDYIKVESGETFIISDVIATVSIQIVEYDSLLGSYDRTFNAIGISSFTVGSNTSYIRVSYFENGFDDLDTIQLELGSSATTYEPYTETTAYTPVLRSVPNGTKDTFECGSGELVQRVSDVYTLLSGDIDSVADGTNLQRVVIGLDAFTGIKTQVVDTADLGTIVSGFTMETNGFDTIGDDNKWYTDATNLYIMVALGTYADVAAARTALTSTVTTTVQYELATPITTQYDPATLIGETNGTVYLEPIKKERLAYGDAINITDITLPINSLDYVTKIDGEVETRIDISDCTVASGGLSFTISGAVSGDVYEFAYRIDGNTTLPTLSYYYQINLVGQAQGTIDQVKELNNKIDKVENELEARYKVQNIYMGNITATTSAPVFVAPFACIITSAKVVTSSNITADNTNYWDIDLINKGSDGTGADVIVNIDTTIATGTSIADYDSQDLGALDADYIQLAKNDVLGITFTKTASGADINNTNVVVEYIPID